MLLGSCYAQEGPAQRVRKLWSAWIASNVADSGDYMAGRRAQAHGLPRLLLGCSLPTAAALAFYSLLPFLLSLLQGECASWSMRDSLLVCTWQCGQCSVSSTRFTGC